MKNKQVYYLPLLALLSLTIGGCEVIGTIFEAGFWSAILLVGLIVLIIIGVIFKTRK